MKNLILGILAAATATPLMCNAASANEPIEQMRSQLFQSICSEQWNEAQSLALALAGSESISTSERAYYLAIRNPILAYQQGVAQFPGCVAGMPISTGEAAAQESSLNWEGAIRSVGSVSTAQDTPPAPIAEVTVYDWRFDSDGWLTGRVVNNTGESVTDVQIQYEIMDASGSLIDSGSFYVDDTSLEAGEATTFSYPPRGGEEGATARVGATWRGSV
jgi:hypothetical protein